MEETQGQGVLNYLPTNRTKQEMLNTDDAEGSKPNNSRGKLEKKTTNNRITLKQKTKSFGLLVTFVMTSLVECVHQQQVEDRHISSKIYLF